MNYRSRNFVALLLSIVGLSLLPACPFISNGNDNTNNNSNDNTNGNDNGNENANENENGNDNTSQEFAVFDDPSSDFSTTLIADADGKTIQLRVDDQTVVYQTGAEYHVDFVWPVQGNFLGAGQAFQVQFGTEGGQPHAYFTETASGTICRYVVTDTSISVVGTSETVPHN